jgi:phosphatidate cytidylyltransferase
MVYAVVCAGACYLLSKNAQFAPGVCALAGLFWIAVAPYLLGRGIKPAPIGAGMAVGIVVLVPAGLALAVLRPGQALMILGLIWVSDTAAYLVGRAIGRRKLAPTISPGKTWEGVAGGAIGCMIYAIIWALFDPDLRTRVQGVVWVPFLAGTLLLCALGVVGDLLESGLKRQAGAKDSGKLLPGHGGVLDRIDSATAALPVALLLLQAMGAT